MSAPRSHSSLGKLMVTVAGPSIGSDSDGLLCLLSKRGCSASAAAFGTWTQGSTVPADQRGACSCHAARGACIVFSRATLSGDSDQ
jgi:hypothetical protein